MSFFSQQLKQRLIDYFISHYGIEISFEQADDYLNSLAKLFDLVNKPAREKK